jgi:hypothetical protein
LANLNTVTGKATKQNFLLLVPITKQYTGIVIGYTGKYNNQ